VNLNYEKSIEELEALMETFASPRKTTLYSEKRTVVATIV